MKKPEITAVLGMQTSPDETGHWVYAFEGFTLNATGRSLKADNCDLELRPKSFDVLCCLVERAGELVPEDEILCKVWSGIHACPSDRSDRKLTTG